MPLSGMTGFARVEGGRGAWTWAVEARSVNGRNLETRFRGPPGFDGLERAARDGAQGRFQRGQPLAVLHANDAARLAEAAALFNSGVKMSAARVAPPALILDRLAPAGAPPASAR